jgi:hypothetical protein
MDRATSFDCENISGNLPSGFKRESNGSNNDRQKSIECIADNLVFKCVWQKPEVNMHLVNQFMNQLNIYNDNEEYEDQTPSNISALLSSSFPSGVVSEKNMDVEEDIEQNVPQFISSTPYAKDSSKIDCSSAKQRSDTLAFQEFNKVSPILSPHRRKNNILTKRRRLQYSFELEDFNFDLERNMKMMKI